MVRKGTGSIVWTKRFRAGVLLYALLLLAVFSLVLDLYLERHLFQERLFQAYQEREQAYALAIYCRDRSKGKKGELQFQEGQTSYQVEGKRWEVEVRLTSGRSYHFSFVAPSHD